METDAADYLAGFVTANCLGAFLASVVPTTISADDSTPDTLALACDADAAAIEFACAVQLLSGSTLSMVFSGVSDTDGTPPYTYRYRVYDSAWSLLSNQVSSDGSEKTYSVPAAGCYYVYGSIEIEDATQLAGTFTISSDDTATFGTVVALWDEGGGVTEMPCVP